MPSEIVRKRYDSGSGRTEVQVLKRIEDGVTPGWIWVCGWCTYVEARRNKLGGDAGGHRFSPAQRFEREVLPKTGWRITTPTGKEQLLISGMLVRYVPKAKTNRR